MLRKILPSPPVHGFTFSRILWNALIWQNLLRLEKGEWKMDREVFDLDDDELEDILKAYLLHRDQ